MLGMVIAMEKQRSEAAQATESESVSIEDPTAVEAGQEEPLTTEQEIQQAQGENVDQGQGLSDDEDNEEDDDING